jgi:hypothetical protein
MLVVITFTTDKLTERPTQTGDEFTSKYAQQGRARGNEKSRTLSSPLSIKLLSLPSI